ncbi:hypothetical protein SEUCBS140593_007246 [Sporothrix eucalyptigena]|uniref:aldehyde dehydrogenase (NAD(+)) n=1 Tax=Sporothrix eucalyptigena TaxID=1812306 RepID=A0ABP0CCR3_9PEZI
MPTVTLIGVQEKNVRIETGLFIGNKFVPAQSESTLTTGNPLNGEPLAAVSAAQREDVDAALDVAKDAFNSHWKAATLTLRAQLLNKLADLIERDADDIASIEALDAGILFSESKGSTLVGRKILKAAAESNLKKIYESFLRAFSERIANTIHGDPLLPETTKGPIISRQQHEKMLAFVNEAKTSGIRLLEGGERLGEKGNFVANTAFADVPQDARIMCEEIFGPVASFAKFRSESEVITKANVAHRVSAALETGQVTVNFWGLLNPNAPFGGIKQSGFGRDLSEESLDGWMTTKCVKFNVLPETI